MISHTYSKKMLSIVGLLTLLTIPAITTAYLVQEPLCTARIGFVGARLGNDAWDDALSNGDIAGTITSVSENTFNSLSPTDLRNLYDVLVFGWASSSVLDGSFVNRVGPYMDLGGSVLWEDNTNVGDMNDLTGFVGLNSGGGGPYTVYTIPGHEVLSNGINGDFVNHHITISTHPSWMKIWIRHGTTNEILAVAGDYGAGKIMISGPDHDFHAVDIPSHTAFNQYKVIVNQFNWLCEQSGTSLCVLPDTQAPSLTCPDPETILADTTCNALCPDVVANTESSDACSDVALTQAPPVGSSLGLGSHIIGVTGTDDANNSDTCSALVSVVDVFPPTMTCPDPQTLSAGSDCTVPSPTLNVVTDDNCSSVNLVFSPVVGSSFGLGTHSISVTGTDASGNDATCSSSVTVVDDTPPTISNLSASPSILWPPNHKFVTVTINGNFNDNCSPSSSVSCSIVGIDVSDDDNDERDHVGDWNITGDHTVELRSERDPNDELTGGRTYTLHVECSDIHGNVSASTTIVVVPHHQ